MRTSKDIAKEAKEPQDLLPATEVSKAKEVALMSGPLVAQIEKLQVTDPESYNMAALYLQKVAGLRAAIEERINHILRPLNDARNAALSLKKSLDRGPSEAEALIRNKMREYKMLEAAEIRRQEQERQAQIKAAEDTQREIERKILQAKTVKMRELLERKKEDAELHAMKQYLIPKPQPAQAQCASSRTVKKVKVSDPMAFLTAVVQGKVPIEMVPIEEITRKVAAHHRVAEAEVEAWPGVESYEEVTIVRVG